MLWHLSDRADPRALPLADRHYSRQKIGTPQFVPPGRCIVLLTAEAHACWVTGWPYAEYVRHAWAGAWINSFFRNESPHLSSDLIRQAVAATRARYGTPPPTRRRDLRGRREGPPQARPGPVLPQGWVREATVPALRRVQPQCTVRGLRGRSCPYQGRTAGVPDAP